jgi:hypothetical protein
MKRIAALGISVLVIINVPAQKVKAAGKLSYRFTMEVVYADPGYPKRIKKTGFFKSLYKIGRRDHIRIIIK